MKNQIFGLCTIILIATTANFLSSCSSKKKSNEPVVAENWYSKMSDLSNSLHELLPLVLDKKKFSDKKNYNRITKLTSDFTKMSHDLRAFEENKMAPNNDPVIRYVSGAFNREIKDVQKLLKEHKMEKARVRMKSVTNYCINCHTSVENTAGNSLLIKENPHIKGITHLQKGEYYVATRQFSEAIKEYEYALSDRKWANGNPNEWSYTIQRLLAVIIQVRNDSSLANEVISRFIDLKSEPKVLKGAVRYWNADVKNWRKEKESKGLKRLEAAKSLVSEAEMKSKKMPARAQMIKYLRASAELHKYLRYETDDSNEKKQEAFYYSSKTASYLGAINTGNLEDDYLEACYNILPKSDLASKCLKEIEIKMKSGDFPRADFKKSLKAY